MTVGSPQETYTRRPPGPADAADGVSLLHVAHAGFTPDPTTEREDERNTQQADPVALRRDDVGIRGARKSTISGLTP
jgi:hypothetical protein